MKRALYILGWGMVWLGVGLVFFQPSRILKIAGLLCIPCGAFLALQTHKAMPHEEAKPKLAGKPPTKRRTGCGVLVFIAFIALLYFLYSAGDISCQDWHIDIETSKQK